MSKLEWISEEDRLPIIAQRVLLLTPRQGGGWWDPRIMMILVRHEGVIPSPVRKGSRWPVEYFWSDGRTTSTVLVTGNGYWASLESINLPPGAEHYTDKHSRAIKQADGLVYALPTGPNQARDGED